MTIERHQLRIIRIDPVPPLLHSGDEAVAFFARRDLLDGRVGPLTGVWELPAARRLLARQEADGSWRPSGSQKGVYPAYHHSLVETFKRFRLMVQRYQFTRESPEVARAAEYLLSCQTPSGDIRGMIGNQYATYYTGLILSLLINAGYTEDSRIDRGMQWLLSMRQDDGGWTVPVLTRGFDAATMRRITSQHAEPVEPDRAMPFSHNWTNMVLQAFAAHPVYRHSQEARAAALMMKSRFFKPDSYSSYRAPSYWIRFAFWWPNLLTALETLASLGFSAADDDITDALDWFADQQREDGQWDMSYTWGKSGKSIPGKPEERLWLTLRICRVLRQYGMLPRSESV
ncbi:MAG: terpene cyclase/mutase family protein [Thermoleophilia bacterium]|nr:terpene cyclase/mutase family protein [Thermoleophilia bacterium]